MTTEIAAPTSVPAVAQRMAEAAKRFLATLTPEQHKAATFPFFGDERYRWDYRPMENTPRNGLWLIAMNDEQKRAAFELLASGMSDRGAEKAHGIMARESILREHERIDQMLFKLVRDPELYWWSVFGEPGGEEPWGWRISGHHIGIHFTLVGDKVASTPLFLGANPAEVRHGPQKGHRVLSEEEDVARDLLAMLDVPRKALAIYSPIAPRDITTDINRRVYPGIAPRGLPFARMDERQRGRLRDLIHVYTGRATQGLADDAWQRIQDAGLETVTFAWSGPEERGHGHYYAVVGPMFMIEYDNVQNNGNHIHSVWREYAGDWGEDLLAAHYTRLHHAGAEHNH